MQDLSATRREKSQASASTRGAISHPVLLGVSIVEVPLLESDLLVIGEATVAESGEAIPVQRIHYSVEKSLVAIVNFQGYGESHQEGLHFPTSIEANFSCIINGNLSKDINHKLIEVKQDFVK